MKKTKKQPTQVNVNATMEPTAVELFYRDKMEKLRKRKEWWKNFWSKLPDRIRIGFATLVITFGVIMLFMALSYGALRAGFFIAERDEWIKTEINKHVTHPLQTSPGMDKWDVDNRILKYLEDYGVKTNKDIIFFSNTNHFIIYTNITAP